MVRTLVSGSAFAHGLIGAWSLFFTQPADAGVLASIATHVAGPCLVGLAVIVLEIIVAPLPAVASYAWVGQSAGLPAGMGPVGIAGGEEHWVPQPSCN
jgi:hypothetical protein